MSMALRSARIALAVLAGALFASTIPALAQSEDATIEIPCLRFAHDLTFGSRDEGGGGEVSLLQEFLVSGGFLEEDSVTGFYGRLTARAMRQWQIKEGIVAPSTASSYGRLGPLSKKRIEERTCGSSAPTATEPTTRTTASDSSSGGTGAVSGVTLSISPSFAYVGEPFTLTWKANNATRCTSPNNSFPASNPGPSGTVTVTPTSAGVLAYWLECSNATSAAWRTITIPVNVRGNHQGEVTGVRRCPVYQAPLCREGERLESGDLDINGCRGPSRCVAVGATPTPIPFPEPTSGFSASPTSGAAPLSVTFYSNVPGFRAPGTKSEIDYGDGSRVPAPACQAPTDFCIAPGKSVHVYSSPGTYLARLIDTTDLCAGSGELCTAPVRTEIAGQVAITVSSAETFTGRIHVIFPNGGEELVTGQTSMVRWEASAIPIPNDLQTSYRVRLAIINGDGTTVGFIPANVEALAAAAGSALWDPASLNGGLRDISKLKIRADLLKVVDRCVTAGAAFLASTPLLCTEEQILASDESDGYFYVKGVSACLPGSEGGTLACPVSEGRPNFAARLTAAVGTAVRSVLETFASIFGR